MTSLFATTHIGGTLVSTEPSWIKLKKKHLRILMFSVAAMAWAPFVWAEQEFSGISTNRISEPSLRRLVTQSSLPRLVDTELPENSGPAVVEITISSEGRVVAISVLEAPTLEIAQSIQRSVADWKFKRTSSNRSVFTVGKLTFYFRSHRAGVEVLDPEKD